jgi:hypothetical protein
MNLATFLCQDRFCTSLRALFAGHVPEAIRIDVDTPLVAATRDAVCAAVRATIRDRFDATHDPDNIARAVRDQMDDCILEELNGDQT